MSQTLVAMFESLGAAAASATEKQDKWIVIDHAYTQLEAWSEHEYSQVLDHILALIEEFPELDYGGPGPFGEFIETQPVGRYSHQLAASLQRRPSVQVLGWLDRTMRMQRAQRIAQGGLERSAYIELLQAVMAHPLASADCREFAQLCLAD